MTALGSRVSGGGDNYDPLVDCFLRSLVNNALRTRDIVISAERYIQHADVVTLSIRDYPVNTFCDLVFSYATAFTHFHQHKFRLMGQASIYAIAELSITRCGNGCLCAVPLPRLY